MSAQNNNNAAAAAAEPEQQFEGQVNTKFAESGQWHDASELSRKDAVPSAGLEAAPNSVIIAEKALGAEFPERAADFVEEKKDEAKDAIEEGAAKAEGLTARAYEKAGELYEKVAEKIAPMTDFAAAAAEKARAAGTYIAETAAATKDAVVDSAQFALEKGREMKDTFIRRNSADLKDAVAQVKEAVSEKTGETTESETKAPLPTGPLSEISSAELLLQKAKINLTADVTKMNDSSLPYTTRAAAAADAVAMKATVLYEQAAIASANAKSTIMEKIAPATERPAQQAQSSQ